MDRIVYRRGELLGVVVRAYGPEITGGWEGGS
jgi:hypothetical protein